MRFSCGDHVRHLKTGGTYVITGHVVLASPEPQPAYLYQRIILFKEPKENKDYPVWCRSQVEMEDGRFKTVTVGYADIYGPEYPT